MKLEAVLQPDALLYMERYVDEGAKTYSPFAARTEAAPRYRPESSEPSFELVTVTAPKDRVSIFQADPSPGLLGRYLMPTGVLFAIHPETWAAPDLGEIHALPREAPIRVAPTASTRTTLTLDHIPKLPRHFLKLHYPLQISRFNRRLRRKNIHNSIEVAKDLAHFHCDRFAYLADALGFVFGDDDDAWGFLVREAVPRPVARDRFLIPCFSLFAGDSKNPGDLPLIVQMIERLETDPGSFIINGVFAPIVECWSRVARERGFLLESHAQNTLIEIDRAFRPRRVVHRDFDVWIDTEARRRRAGLESNFLGMGTGPDRSIEQRYSLVYDRFIGHEFFDYLLATVKRFYEIDEDSVRSRVRKAFHTFFPDADRFFPPRTMFYFTTEPGSGREFELEDMREAPIWR